MLAKKVMVRVFSFVLLCFFSFHFFCGISLICIILYALIHCGWKSLVIFTRKLCLIVLLYNQICACGLVGSMWFSIIYTFFYVQVIFVRVVDFLVYIAVCILYNLGIIFYKFSVYDVYLYL